MRPLVLNNTNKSLQAVLGGAITTNQPHFVATWADSTGTSFTEGSSEGVLNSTTDVEIVGSPAASTQRIIKSLAIYNADTVDVDLELKYDDGTNQRTIVKVTLAPGDTWTLEGVFTSGGLLKSGQVVVWGDIEGVISDQADVRASGVWTLTMEGGTTVGDYDFTPQNNTNIYIKALDGLIYVFGHFVVTVNTGGTGDAIFGGLPEDKPADRVFVGGGIETNGVQLPAGAVDLTIGSVSSAIGAGMVIRATLNNSAPEIIEADDFSTGDEIILTLVYPII